jgi:outer membrane receptor protein involved in Fe transport
VATRLFNESWKPSAVAGGWYQQYSLAYLGARLTGATDADAHTLARSQADVGRPVAGSAQFTQSYDSIRKKPIKTGGALLLDKSDLYTLEGNYNMSHLTGKWVDLLIGGSYRQYVLNSECSLFADSLGHIKISEYGAYMQLSRKIMDRLHLTVSGRYDKNENFKGRITPRATALIKIKENNNFRLSYQTAYRFPSNQQQFINLGIGSNVFLIGGNPGFREFYNFAGKPTYDFDALRAGNVVAFNPQNLKPESLSSFEAGFKGLMLQGKLLVDVYGYFGTYKDFLGRKVTVQQSGAAIALSDTLNGRRLSIPVNSTDKVKTYGFGLSLDYRLPLNFTIGANVASDILTDVPTNFVAYFNAPKYKANVNLGNSGFGPGKRLGFNVAYRYQGAFLFQGDFATGNLPVVQTLDAQVSLKLPKANKSIIKLGATNLLNQYYYNAIGNAQVGGLYYVSFGYNIY